MLPINDSIIILLQDLERSDKSGSGFEPSGVGLYKPKHNYERIDPDASVKSRFLENNHPARSLLKISGGYLNYTYDYRSGLDTPYTGKSFSQHLVNANLHITVAETYPLTVFFFERETNSDFFRSYRDVRIDFDFRKYRQIQQAKQLKELRDLVSSVADSTAKNTLHSVEAIRQQCTDWLNSASVVGGFIKSKELLGRMEFADSAMPVKDSLIKSAQRFVALYDQVQKTDQHYQHIYDSLLRKISGAKADLKRIDDMIAGENFDPAFVTQMAHRYELNDKSTNCSLPLSQGFQRVSVGRSIPDFSSLTLQNLNVNGLYSEYAKNHVYIALAAGAVTYQFRDFLYRKMQLPKQYVLAGRVGYGTKEGNHLIFTYYTGRKQLFGGNLQAPASVVQGMSLEGQYQIFRNTRIAGEIAQSGFPNTYPDVFASKLNFHFTDKTQRAYRLSFHSTLNRINTQLEGYYQHGGMYFQSFNLYPYHSAVDRWYGSLRQNFLKRQITIQATVRKNDFANPTVLQRYSANTVYESVNLSFRKAKWPTLSVGYMPSSQYTVIDSTVYENHYQMLTGATSCQYRLGLAKGVTSIIYSRFFNSSNDSALIYYHSRNIYLNQMFVFQKFSTAVNLSSSRNRQYLFQVAEGSITARLFKKITLGGTIRMTSLNNEIAKIGFNTSTRFKIGNIGEVLMYADKSYFPTSGKQLYKYETYNIGFTKYFNQQ